MIEYRRAHVDDAPSLGRIHAQNFCANNKQELTTSLTAEFGDLWKKRLLEQKANQLILVAAENKTPLGFVCVFGDEDPKWGSLIDNLHVSDSARRKGFGSSLLKQAFAWLLAHYKDEAVYLLVLESNSVARALYEGFGGECIETLESETHGGSRVKNCRYTWESPG